MKEQDDFDAWLLSETLLAGLLGAILALFLTHPGMRTRFNLPELRLVLETTMALAGILVALLAGVRFSVTGPQFQSDLVFDWLQLHVNSKKRQMIDEVQVEGAELVEGVSHGHATGAGPALVVAVEVQAEEAGVKGDEGECCDSQPECCSLEKRRTPGGLNSGIQTTFSGGWDECAMAAWLWIVRRLPRM